MKKMLILFLTLLLFIVACSKSGINPLSDDIKNSQAKAELEGIIKHSPYFSDSNQEDSSTSRLRSLNFVVSEFKGTVAPNNNWYRRCDWQNVYREIIIEPLDLEQGKAWVEVNTIINGYLRTATNGLQLIEGPYIDKPFTHYITRKAYFERENGKWKLRKISPAYASYLPLDNTPKIEIVSVKVYRGTETTPIIIITNTETLYDKDTLPQLTSGEVIKVKLTAENNLSGTNYCYIHRYLYRRDAMGNESGSSYTNTYTVGQIPGIYQAWFDAIDKKTIDDILTETNYASVLWGIPYRVE